MMRDLHQWQWVGKPIWWCHHLVYLHRLSCHQKCQPATSDLYHLTLMNRGELLWQRMAYLIPAHLQCWPQPSCNALGLSALPTTGQSNFGHIHFLWKVQEEREWGKDVLGAGGGAARKGRGELYRFRLVVIRSTWSKMLILKPTLSKGRGSGCYQIRQSQDETGEERLRGSERERTGKETVGFLRAPLHGPRCSRA